ncbi:hypothetical protein [Ulvibacter litoralis]|uniref:Uncharacterized protein n=1 Tax=Ulvibacter litoralis TaxID=227084 RepID=A0A1G7HGM8_9FLAO|nr:hypothetical protein [Ulvibacter litoralis]GHC57727.1 hypothetical protein GCM10008083_22920 [Ulvibacter litoralis]SDE99486.1 hypothetical protein SAMN05421855_10480 [Ulvibacter litoralis]
MKNFSNNTEPNELEEQFNKENEEHDDRCGCGENARDCERTSPN